MGFLPCPHYQQPPPQLTACCSESPGWKPQGKLQIHLELLFLEHVRVGSIENVIRQLGLAVNVDRSGGFATQEFTEDLPGPVRELTGRKV